MHAWIDNTYKAETNTHTQWQDMMKLQPNPICKDVGNPNRFYSTLQSHPDKTAKGQLHLCQVIKKKVFFSHHNSTVATNDQK